MERCATCKWWGSSKDRADYADGDGRDERAQRAGAKICALSVSPDCPSAEEEKAVTKNGMWAEDCSGYYAHLRTKPDFGCVKHEPKA